MSQQATANELLAAAVEAVQKAREAFERADAEYRVAYAAATQFRNALNDAQKKFDAHVSAFKSNSPWDTHWRESLREVGRTER